MSSSLSSASLSLFSHWAALSQLGPLEEWGSTALGKLWLSDTYKNSFIGTNVVTLWSICINAEEIIENLKPTPTTKKKPWFNSQCCTLSLPQCWCCWLAGRIHQLQLELGLRWHLEPIHSCSVYMIFCGFWEFLPVRSASHSLCRCTAFLPCESWCASAALLEPQKTCRTVCSCMVFLPCESACVWSKSTAAQMSSRSRSSGRA